MHLTRCLPVLSLLAAATHAQSVGLRGDAPFADLRRTVPLIGELGHVTLADLDGDGAPELVHATRDAAEILFNDGDGGLRPLENPAAPFGSPTYSSGARSAAGDLDGDGNVDLLLGSIPWFGDGTGRFQAVPGPVPALLDVDDSLLVDVDGDGDLDLMFGDFNTYLLRNEGGRTFLDASSQVPDGGVRSLLALDVDGDGDQDVVRDEDLLRNDGSGNFTLDDSAIPYGLNFSVLESADVDGDGDPDLVGTAGTLTLLRNTGGGIFAREVIAPSTTVLSFSLADFDHDGDPDILSVTPPLLLENDGSGAFRDAGGELPEPLSGFAGQQIASDVDRDGDLDVLWLRFAYAFVGGPTPLGLWLGDGEGGFVEVQRHLPPDSFFPLELADVDGDGDLDLLGQPGLGPFGPNAVPVRLNDGSGLFTPAPELFQSIPQPTLGANDVACGDVDGDGDVDLLWAASTVRLYVNEGPQGFFDRTSAQLPQQYSGGNSAVVLADFDDDGDLDALTSGAPFIGNPGSRLWRNDGAGTFKNATNLLPPRNATTYAVACGDVDGDGALDLLLAGVGQNALFLGDGTGRFVDGTAAWLPLEMPGRVTYDVALGDLDGDGDLDAYFAKGGFSSPPSYEGGLYPISNEVLINDGDALRVRPELHRTFDVGYEVELLDVEGDGDLDVLVGTETLFTASMVRGGETALYRNQGDGTLLLDPSVGGQQDLYIACGDVDQDGDVDVVLSERVLTNVRRALAWRTLPRIGLPLRLELYGPPQAPFHLLMGDATAALATDAGSLRLDPGSIGLVVQGQLGPHGRGAVELLPPASLLGQTLYWQALLGAPGSFALTNLEPTTFFGN